jgi:hypothetical protein
MKRLLISGSRPPRITESTPAIVRSKYNELLACVSEFVTALPTETLIITGGAAGVDCFAESEAEKRGLWVCRVPVSTRKWTSLGKRAGVVRDQIMLNMADSVACFRLDKSRGTTFVLEHAGDKLVHLVDLVTS